MVYGYYNFRYSSEFQSSEFYSTDAISLNIYFAEAL